MRTRQESMVRMQPWSANDAGFNRAVLRGLRVLSLVSCLQDPDALRTNHDTQTYDELSEAWRQVQIENPEMTLSSGHTHMQVECTEITSSEPPHAQKIDSPGTSVVSGGDAARGVVQV